MKAIPFPQANKVLKAPSGQEADVYDLSVWGGEVEGVERCISCWEPSPEERALIAAGGPVWLWVVGHTHPPLVLDAANPFEPAAARPAEQSGLWQEVAREIDFLTTAVLREREGSMSTLPRDRAWERLQNALNRIMEREKQCRSADKAERVSEEVL